MESEICRKIREILEMFDIDYNKVIGEWNLLTHLNILYEKELDFNDNKKM